MAAVVSFQDILESISGVKGRMIERIAVPTSRSTIRTILFMDVA